MAAKIEAQLISRTATQCAAASPVFTDTIFLYIDIGRTRSDLFSSRVKTFSRQSAAPRLIASPFFNTSFFIFGERKSRQVSKQRNPYFRRAQQPAGGSPFLRHLSLFFHGNSFSRSGRGNTTPSLSVLSSHCKHGMSVRMNQFVLIFSGDVLPAGSYDIRYVHPSFSVSKLNFTSGGRQFRQAHRLSGLCRVRVPEYCPPFLRHLLILFHNRNSHRNGRGNIRPSLSVLPSLREHGLSVRMSQSLLTFSWGVRPAAVCGIQGLRPSFFRLYEQFFIIH